MKYEHQKEFIRKRADSVYLNGSKATPEKVLDIMSKLTFPKYDDRALALFDPIIALHLKQFGVEDVTLYMPTINEKMLPWLQEMQIQAVDTLDEEMKKFDLALLNSPYKGVSALHQQFFNNTVDLLEEGGRMASVHPASPYINNKTNKKSADQIMLDNVAAHTSSVMLLDGHDVFPNAVVGSNLAITHLEKDYSGTNVIDHLQYSDGSLFEDIDVAGIVRTEMNPHTFLKLRSKVQKYIDEYGAIQDIIVDPNGTGVDDHDGMRFYLQVIRGNMGSSDFFTFCSRDDSYDEVHSGRGIPVNNKKQLKNVRAYLESKVARFCLSILKFNVQLSRGELSQVPIVNFNYVWDDESLCELFGINKSEFKEIERVIPDYY